MALWGPGVVEKDPAVKVSYIRHTCNIRNSHLQESFAKKHLIPILWKLSGLVIPLSRGLASFVVLLATIGRRTNPKHFDHPPRFSVTWFPLCSPPRDSLWPISRISATSKKQNTSISTEGGRHKYNVIQRKFIGTWFTQRIHNAF